jgi:acyl-CoA synthetase (AMP-forming)/AMP-acid ligase II
MTTAPTLAERVRNLAAERPADIFAKLLFSGAEPVTITYEDLLREAGRFANFYASRGVRRQDAVLIILDHSADVIYAHVGAMLLGAVPSLLAFPSDKVPASVYWEQLRLIFALCQPRLVVTYDPLLDRLESDRRHGYLGPIERASAAKAHRSDIDPVPLSPDDVAVLQHSSGTTGMKKGVALSHRAVLNQLRNYASALHLGSTDHIISWAPLYHDMGLMAGYLLPLSAGIRVTFISTFEWLARPALFLEAISKERGTVAWMPNFAYAFMAKTVPDEHLRGVDLTSLRALINAGEPISDENHQAFVERFKGYGLRASALATAYGMAENTLAVTQGGITAPLKVIEVDWDLFSRTGRAVPAGPETQKRRRLVSSGTLLPNNEVRIVGDSGDPVDDGCLGEIWVRSDSVMRGYHRRPDLDEEVFSDGWYRTGDLGFLLDGELFVTGRKKDMMIVAGKNIYPQDVDEIASAVPGVYPGRVVAFSVPNEELGTEDVVIMAETLLKEERQRWELKMKVAVAVRQRLECAVTEVVLCDHMTLLKSSSGKISRPANRELYLRGREGGRPADPLPATAPRGRRLT